ncbi:auxin-responsive protein SAUR21-like [Rutidosis leptorrhynchoides]|uniref:auxin-responsive protein SAUR21-like n=1 Tax=Rutidosis leptorrhynchoides TaxID=125765 RepID=UPI003A9A1042
MGIMLFSSSLLCNVKSFSKLNVYGKRNNQMDVPKGHLAVYVGENEKRRFVVPLSFLEQPLFQDLLRQSEEEYGFDHPMGGLTVSCQEDKFFELISVLYFS